MTRVWGRGDGPLVIGHRGASALELENTLPAFRRARTDGADAIELDVLLCKTGEIIVFHDDDLKRLAGRKERIADLPFAAVREVRLAGGVTIPTLDEVVEELGPDMLINIELKANQVLGARRLVPAVVALIRRHGLGRRALCSSFNPLALGQLRATAPELLTGFLFHARQPRPLREAWPRWVVRPFALHPEDKLVEAHVAAWHAAGYPVFAWTVDDLARVRALAAVGVDGLFTNDPARTRAAL